MKILNPILKIEDAGAWQERTHSEHAQWLNQHLLNYDVEHWPTSVLVPAELYADWRSTILSTPTGLKTTLRHIEENNIVRISGQPLKIGPLLRGTDI